MQVFSDVIRFSSADNSESLFGADKNGAFFAKHDNNTVLQTTQNAIKKLNKLKNRSGPISVIAPNRKTAIDWMNIRGNQKSKIKGMLIDGNTVIVTAKKNVCSNLIMGGGRTLGIRIPKHDFCRELSNKIFFSKLCFIV